MMLDRPTDRSRAAGLISQPWLLGRVLLLACVAAFLQAGPALPAESDQTIYVLVNDEPISAYDVGQRIKLLRMRGKGSGVSKEVADKFNAEMAKRKANLKDRFIKFAIAKQPELQSRQPSKDEVKKLQAQFLDGEKAYAASLKERLMSGSDSATPGLRDKAIADLIADRLKLQEARRLDMQVDNAELDEFVTDIAKRNEKTVPEFAKMLASQGIAIGHFREQLRASIAWRRVIARRFRGQVAVGQSEIDSMLSAPVPAQGGGDKEAEDETSAGAAPGGQEIVELKLQRIAIPLAGKLDQSVMAARYQQAEIARARVKGCADLAAAVKAVDGGRHENLGAQTLDRLPEAVRPVLANAEKGDVTPPILTGSSIEIYAVCDKTVGKAASSSTARDSARTKIENQKIAAMSKGLLSDLCSQAFIEFRNGIKAGRTCSSD